MRVDQARQLRAERIRSGVKSVEEEEKGMVEDDVEQFEGRLIFLFLFLLARRSVILQAFSFGSSFTTKLHRLLKRVDKIEHFSGMINAKMDKLIER